MIGQIVEVVETDRHLSLEYGRMLLRSREGLLARIALDDILAVIINPHGATMSAAILAALAERNCPVVIAGKDFKPTAIPMPLVGNFEVAARLEAQVRASPPAKKAIVRGIAAGVPKDGRVDVMLIADRQYANITTIRGERRLRRENPSQLSLF